MAKQWPGLEKYPICGALARAYLEEFPPASSEQSNADGHYLPTIVFILQLISGILLSDVNQNKVSIMYLPLLEDLELVGRFSWGSAVLACLYRELCRVLKPSTKTIGNCSLLLQSWASTAVLGVIPNVIFSISEPPTFLWMPYAKEEIVALIPLWVIE
ncbi:hypothetical protein J1N35_015546 [Gossypium stocksii]|uniref:Aminotransferase-like plant mobile domain-containing protein n=1 Tax=Gossypium stocksii TaxID=47602 RepID=A0A9D3VX54_9ROSI|nr:hypothetical protein J1N35_015546 [Gossypium stocksii]